MFCENFYCLKLKQVTSKVTMLIAAISVNFLAKACVSVALLLMANPVTAFRRDCFLMILYSLNFYKLLSNVEKFFFCSELSCTLREWLLQRMHISPKHKGFYGSNRRPNRYFIFFLNILTCSSNSFGINDKPACFYCCIITYASWFVNVSVAYGQNI